MSKKKSRINKPTKIIILVIALVIIAIAAIAAYFNVAYADRTFPNITINNEDYSGLTKEEALLKFENKIKETYKEGFVFAREEKTFQTDIMATGAIIDISKTISNALNYGRNEDLAQRAKEQLALVGKKKDFSIEIIVDEEKFESYIKENLSSAETPPENFSYKYEKKEFVPILSKSGMMIDKKQLKRDILKNLSVLKNNEIIINLKLTEAEIKEDLENNALLQANNLLNKEIILKYNSNEFKIHKEDAALWIKFSAVDNLNSDDSDNKNISRVLGIMADNEKIKDYLITFVVPRVNRGPVNAQLEFKNKKVEVFSLSQEGIALNVEKSADEIARGVFKNESYSESRQDGEKENIQNTVVEMITEKIQPEITTESIDNMGITALLAMGESNFYGSPKNRQHNITVGASKFNGVLIGPGDEFSFNKVLGSVGPKQGYLPELVIKKGVTTPEYGGGLCQVSTTAFRAAVNAGLEITERKNHAYPVKYYNPQGTDATIYPPHPDLRFKNNTPAYILIQTRIEGNKLFFDFYGSDDERKVKLEGPYAYDKRADGSMKATWTQEVYDKNGELKFKKVFYSNYKSPALYPRGTPLE